jgi:hypothetical protein
MRTEKKVSKSQWGVVIRLHKDIYAYIHKPFSLLFSLNEGSSKYRRNLLEKTRLHTPLCIFQKSFWGYRRHFRGSLQVI